nr:hypothetical protein [Clostridia bacterium]
MIKNSKLIKKTAAASLAAMMMVQPVSAAIEIPVEEPIIVSPVGGKNLGKGIDGVSGITLSDAILKMKMVLGDTKDYENFEYSYSENGDTTIYNLNWSSSKERPDLNVSIGSDGTIYNYNSYIDYRGDNIVIPEITKNQAR